jgi:hypothetical protein
MSWSFGPFEKRFVQLANLFLDEDEKNNYIKKQGEKTKIQVNTS